MNTPRPTLIDTLRGPGALRLGLASLVVVHHLSRFAIGTAAVYVFFLLSGYWIQRMWTHKYAHTVHPYRTFIVSRVWRLMPVFVVVNLITIAGMTQFEAGNAWLTVNDSWLGTLHLVLSNIFILGYGDLAFLPVGPGWSLDVEARFYLLAPAIVWLVQRRAGTTLAAGLALSITAVALGAQGGLAPYLGFFIAGMVASQVAWRPTGRQAAVPLALMVAVIAVALAVPALRPAVLGGAQAGASHEWMNPIFSIVVAVLAFPYAIYTAGRRGGRHDGLMADMAYIVYLLHWIVSVALGAALAGWPPLQRLPVVAVAVLGVYAASWVLWKWIDRPMNRRRAHWVASRSPDRRREAAYLADEAGPPQRPRNAWATGNG